MAISSTDFQNLARAVSAYSDEAYTGARKYAGTALVGTDARISGTDEDYYGSIRWYKPLGDTLSYAIDGGGSDDDDGTETVINIGNQTPANEGRKTSISTDVAEYIKTVRTHGADQMTIQSVISGQDGLSKIARDFGETRARDEDAALIAIMNGVARAEATRNDSSGDTGQTSPDTLQAADTEGFYVDLSDTTVQGFYAGSAGKLVDDGQSSIADKISPLLAATSIGYKDREPEYFYLCIQPSVYLTLRQANLLDEQDHVTDGNVQFETILNGKYRLIVSRTAFRAQNGVGGVASASTKTSFLVQPGALSMVDIAVPNPVAIDRDESVGMGTGMTEAWYRWGYVMHPRGYTWDGAKTKFAQNVTSVGTKASISGYESTNATHVSPWTRKSDLLNLGILPIFHV